MSRLSRDARLDYLIEDAERAAEPCLDCEVGEPHMCRDVPAEVTK